MGVETHNNRYFYDTDTVNFVEMLGGYIDGNYFISVRFGAKILADGKNTLYVVISQEGIKKDEVVDTHSPKKVGDIRSRSSIISVSKVLENVNSKDILRYVPDGFLSGERLKAKYEAIAETIKYTNDKNDRKYREYIKKGDMKSAQRMVKAAAKAAGYNSPLLFHGTDSFGFTVFRTQRPYINTDMPIFASTLKENADTYHLTENGKTEIGKKESNNITAEDVEKAYEKRYGKETSVTLVPGETPQYKTVSATM